MTTEALIIKDPVFAAYLLYRGHEPVVIEPSVKGEQAKSYVYGIDVRDAHYDRPFLGSRMPKDTISWRNFITWMDRLIEIEDLRMHQRHDRQNESGIILHRDNTCFSTTNQAVASYILSLSDPYNILPIDTQQLGRDRGFRFIFSEGDRVFTLYNHMLENDDVTASWQHAKDMYKLATMIRREQVRAPIHL